MAKSSKPKTSLLYVPPEAKEKPVEEVLSAEIPTIYNPLTQKYKIYFGKRNKIDLDDFSEKNFKDPALTASLTAYQANRVAESIVEETPLAEFSVLELRPLIGTTTLALLEYPEIIHIYASEYEYFSEFDANISAYNLERRVTREDEIQTFNRQGIAKNVALIHLDPGSLTKTQRTDLTLVMTKLMGAVAMIFIPVPAGIKLDFSGLKLQSVLTEYLKIDNNYNLFCLRNTPILETIDKNRFKTDSYESLDDWQKRAIKFLKDLLPRFDVKEKFLDETKEKNYFDVPAMEIWTKAFTHKSVSKDNYENLEAIGDMAFKGTFGLFVAERLPEVDKEQLTLLNQQFMSKLRQPDYSIALGLDKYLRTRTKVAAVVRKANEDLCESFTCALYLIANRVEGYSIGFARVMKMLKVIFVDLLKIKFKEEIKKDMNQPKTRIKQRMDKVFMRAGMDITTSDNGYVAVVYIKTREANEFFRSIGIIIPDNRQIGVAKRGGFNQEEVSNLAYIDALDNLDKLGFTDERAALESERLRKGDPSLTKYTEQIVLKRTSQGLDAIYFIYDNITQNMKLYGVLSGKKLLHVLIKEYKSPNPKEAKIRILEKWLGE